MEMNAVAIWISNTFASFDQNMVVQFHKLYDAAGGFFTPFFEFISELGHGGIPLIIIALILMLFRKTRRCGTTMLIAIAIGALITNCCLKILIARPRPYSDEAKAFFNTDLYQRLWMTVGQNVESDKSFPSGHTTAAFAAMTSVFLVGNKKVSWTASPTAVNYKACVASGNNTCTPSTFLTNGSGYNTIVSATGSRTVYINSVCDSTYYNTTSSNASGTTTVYSVTLTPGTGISAVSGGGNYITGATVNIDATVSSGYIWSNWTQTSGGSQVSTTKAYSTTISSNLAYTANAIPINYINTTTNVGYSTLNAAFAAVANNQTIKVLQNVTETTQATLASGKTGVKLDLNGKTINMSNTYMYEIFL